MFWNKKEDDKSLPDLPPLKTDFPTMSSENSSNRRFEEPPKFSEKPSIPSFPEHPSKDIEDIKNSTEDLEKIPSHSSFKTQELPSQSRLPEPPLPPMPEEKSKSDIFVKIDKFNSSKKALMMVQDKVKEIESQLKKIREVRMREDQELEAWESALAETKTKMESVSKNLFDKAE